MKGQRKVSIGFFPVQTRAGLYTAQVRGGFPGTWTVLVRFDATRFPLDRFYCFMRHKDESLPYTFTNMEFAPESKGLRVGPWPGWRSIPDMPRVTLRTADGTIAGRFQFWGDESACGHLRAIFQVESGIEGIVELHTGESGLAPIDAVMYRGGHRGAEPVPPGSSDAGVASMAKDISRDGRTDRRRLMLETDIATLRSLDTPWHVHMRERIEELLSRWDLPPRKTAESKLPQGPERLFPEDRVVLSAFTALLQPAEEQVARAVSALMDFEALTETPGYEPLGIDTQSGETLFVLCLGFDWLEDALTCEERDRLRQRLGEIADVCDAHLRPERRDYGQAHYLGCAMGLLAYALRFRQEHKRAEKWIATIHGAARRAISMLPEDGYYPHGINLWIYEHGFLLRILELFRLHGGVDLWRETRYWAAASRFRAAATSPDGLLGVTFGDPQFRVGGDSWCHYLIARRTGSGIAQWLGNRLFDQPQEGVDFRHAPSRRRVYEYLFYDTTVAEEVPRERVEHFRDGGQVFVQGREALFTMRCGAPLGGARYESGERGAYGHADPCNGSFMLAGDGGLIVSGPGPVYRRDTAIQNLVTIDGSGQIGDSVVWLPDFFPPEVIPDTLEVDARQDGNVAMTCNLARAYLPSLGVTGYRRTIVVSPAGSMSGEDTIALDRKRRIDWQIHTWGTVEWSGDTEHGAFKFSLGKRRYILVFEAPEGVDAEIFQTPFVPAYPNDGRRDTTLQFRLQASDAVFRWTLEESST